MAAYRYVVCVRSVIDEIRRLYRRERFIQETHFEQPGTLCLILENADDDVEGIVPGFPEETRDESEGLEEMACDHLQGSRFSKPLPAIDFERFLQVHQ